jgi:transcriptional enhancer factor
VQLLQDQANGKMQMMNMEVMSVHSETDDPNGEGEGVWSPEIEQAFQEALKLFPPCGRRKHILQEEGGGKMYGRNELIARYIEQKTGHRRTRKQVSSHIQVLSRREARSKASSRGGDTDSVSPASSITASSIGGTDRVLSRPDSATSGYNNGTSPMELSNPIHSNGHHLNHHAHHLHQQPHLNHHAHHLHQPQHLNPITNTASLIGYDLWEDRPIMTRKIRLVEFSAFIEQRKPNNIPLATTTTLTMNGTGFHRHSYVKIDYRQPSERLANKMERIDIREIQDKFPDIGGPDGLFQRGSPDSFFLVKFWADLDFDSEHSTFEDQNSYFGFSSQFETSIPYKDITCSTKACSYGHQVVEKVENVYGVFNSLNNTYLYAINRSPMCEFMIQFIKKLRQLPELPLMNRILENFTVLQIVTSESNSEILLCIAYVFEIASLRQTSRGSHYHVYKLTKD